MLDWQSLETYNKIGSYQFGEYFRQMSAELSEIDRLRNLDPQTITAIHNRYYPEVYRFARFRVSDERVAEDIASEVFKRLLEAVHSGRGPDTNLRGWLIRTTANIVNDHFRMLYNHPMEDSERKLDNMELFLAETDPVELSEQAERLRLLHKAFDQLTDPQKLVITLRFGSRFSLEETAVIMGKDANTIKALQYRAMVALRRRMEKEM